MNETHPVSLKNTDASDLKPGKQAPQEGLRDLHLQRSPQSDCYQAHGEALLQRKHSLIN